jgi:hypothetical protein
MGARREAVANQHQSGKRTSRQQTFNFEIYIYSRAPYIYIVRPCLDTPKNPKLYKIPHHTNLTAHT